MAKIKHSDIFEDNLFQQQIKEAQALKAVLDELAKTFQTIGKAKSTYLQGAKVDDYTSIKKTNTAIDEAVNAYHGLNEVNKEKVKIDKIIQEQQKTTNKILEETTKSLNDNIATRLKLEKTIKSYQQDLKDDLDLYKKSVITEKELKERKIQTIATIEKYKASLDLTNKSIKEQLKDHNQAGNLYKELSKHLNTLRNAYKDLALQGKSNTKEAKDLLFNITKLDKELKTLDKTVVQNSRNVGGYSEMFGKLKNTFFAVSGALASIGLSFGTFKKIIESTEAGADKFKATMTGLSYSIEYFFRAISTGDWSNFLSNLGDAYERGIKYSEGVDLISKRTAALDYFDAKQKKQMTELEEAMRNENLTKEERLKAAKDLMKLTEAEYERRKDLAEQDLINSAKSLNLTIKVGKARRKMTTTEKKETIAFMLEQDALNEKLREDAENYNEELEKLNLALEKAKTSKEVVGYGGTIKYTEDVEKVKQVNEAILKLKKDNTDEVIKYAKILSETEGRLSKEALEDIKKKLTDRQKAEFALYVENKRNVNTYHSLQKEFRDKQQKADDDFIAKKKKEAEELRKDYAFNVEKIKAIEKELEDYKIAIMEDGLEKQKAIEELRFERKKKEIENLKFLQYNKQTGKTEEVPIDKSLSDALIEAETKQHEKNMSKIIQDAQDENDKALIASSKANMELKKEIRDEDEADRKERMQKEGQDMEESLEMVDAYLEARHEKQQKAIDREIKSNEDRIQQLRDLANRGVDESTKTLAYEERKKAELQKQKDKAEKQQRMQELGMTALKTYASKVEQGDKNPLMSTMRDIVLLRELVKGLGSFYEGTEDTGKEGNLDSKGGKLAILHPHERVLTAKQNEQLDGISNVELSNLGSLYKKGKVIVDAEINHDRWMSNNMILRKFDELKNAIESKPTYLGRDYDATSKAVIETIERKGNLIREHRKLSI